MSADTLVRDILFSIRVLIRKPGYSAWIIAILAVGIGANTAIFSVFYAVLLKPLPYNASERIVRIFATTPEEGNDPEIKTISFPDYLDFKKSMVFEEIVVNDYGRYVLNVSGSHAELLVASRVSRNFFTFFNVTPREGRSFIAEEDRPDGPPVVMISEGLWQRRFGREAIIGKQIALDGSPFTVIGILPGSFRIPSELSESDSRIDLWMPVTPTAHKRGRGIFRFEAYARLREGISIDFAREKMETVAKNLETYYPETNKNISATVMSLKDVVVRRSRMILYMLLTAVILVLLIGSANAANLMLSRGAARKSEMAIRKALGAGRLQIAQQLLTESVLLSVVAGLVGFLIAMWATDFFVSFYPGAIPRLFEADINLPVFGFNLIVSLLTGVVFGLAPAWRGAGGNLFEAMKGATGIFQPAGAKRTGSLLAVAEIAMAVALAIGAGLLIRSFSRMMSTDPGIITKNLLTMRVALPAEQYADNHRAIEFFRQFIERLNHIPEIQSASAVHILPFSGGFSCDSFTVDDRPLPAGEGLCAEYRSVLPEYFKTMGISLLLGRTFTHHDRSGATQVAIINETMARKFWPGRNPIGRTVTSDTGERVSRTVIGIVKDIRHFGVAKPAEPELYIPFYQDAWPRNMTIVLRTNQQPNSIIPIVRAQLAILDKNLPIVDIATMEELLGRSVAQPRFRSVLFGSLSALAVFLAVLGVYSVMSYSTARRTREVGIRLALGARPQDVTRMITAEGMLMASAGIGTGLLLALLLTRFISSLLYGIATIDLTTYVLVPCFVAAAAFLASYLPARRATKVSPLDALKYE